MGSRGIGTRRTSPRRARERRVLLAGAAGALGLLGILWTEVAPSAVRAGAGTADGAAGPGKAATPVLLAMLGDAARAEAAARDTRHVGAAVADDGPSVAAGEPDRSAPPPEHRGSEAWIADLIEDLRDDHEFNNASRALRILEARDAAVPHLLTALDSDDLQQRQLAAMVLVRRGEEPTARLYQVLVEALRDDDLWHRNAQAAAEFLDDVPWAAGPHLVPALSSDDPQQRFLAAYLLARGGTPAPRAAACAVLIEHLADNDVPYDGELARDTLTQLGHFVLPQLVAAERVATDRQQIEMLRAIQVAIVRRAEQGLVDPARLGPRSDMPLWWLGRNDAASGGAGGSWR